MKLVFVHGWGCHGGIWLDLADRLKGHEPVIADLSFLRDGYRGASALPPDAVCIGHSFGVMWLLKHGPRPMRGLVSIAGFDCFHKHVPDHVLPTMMEGLRKDPDAQMRHFWKLCGIGEEGPGGMVDPGPLRAGLKWLSTWDASAQREALNAPILALASRDDTIVRPPMTEASWGDGKADLRWLESGGHMLPLTHADWCAEQIRGFIDQLDD
ncbi:MAG: hypothetical protein D6773_11965 [Alphaproteobacteria bacterium]|nr:MAG: hypothetical protein D6773_11965 [Alphaproteobacteria bacterium]